jgi:hypothetical protein
MANKTLALSLLITYSNMSAALILVLALAREPMVFFGGRRLGTGLIIFYAVLFASHACHSPKS